jgi:hypothetical protein
VDLLDLRHCKLEPDLSFIPLYSDNSSKIQANGVQFILVLFLCPETRYLARDSAEDNMVGETRSTFKKQYMTFFRRLTSQHLSPKEFYSPLKLFAFLEIAVPIVACSIVFDFASVFFTVELPPLFQKRFKFNPEQSGLQFLSLIIGYVPVIIT